MHYRVLFSYKLLCAFRLVWKKIRGDAFAPKFFTNNIASAIFEITFAVCLF